MGRGALSAFFLGPPIWKNWNWRAGWGASQRWKDYGWLGKGPPGHASRTPHPSRGKSEGMGMKRPAGTPLKQENLRIKKMRLFRGVFWCGLGMELRNIWGTR